MELSEAIGLAKAGKAILFTGAGFSYGAKNSVEKLNYRVPIADKFATYLGELMGLDKSYPLNTISQFFKKKFGEHRLVEELLNCFNITSVTDSHREISSFPWQRVYTTNYDNCFEKASSERGISWHPIDTNLGISASNNRVVHVNGHIFDLDIRNVDERIKLTHTSYSMDGFEKSRWAQQLRQDFDSAKAIIFVGYSLSDMDIAKVIRNVYEIRKKTVFVVGPDEDEISTSFLEDFGTVYPIGVDDFAMMCSEVEFIQEPDIHEFTWLNEFKPPQYFLKPDDQNCFDLFTKGIWSIDKMAWSLSNTGNPDNNYSIKRTNIEFVLAQMDNGRRWFLIHSDMGNGKTVFKLQLSLVLDQQNYKVFWDTDIDLNKLSDIRRLRSIKGKIALFIDETSNRFNVIEGLLGADLDNVTVFVSARSTLYELAEAKFDEFLPVDYIPIDLNVLHEQERSEFVRVLDNSGLWGGVAERRRLINRGDKMEFLENGCSGSIAKLILTLFEESELGRRFVNEAQKFLLNRSKTSQIVVLSFLLNVIDERPSFDLLSKILDCDVWDVSRTAEFERAKEFISVESNSINARSSVFSSYLLQNALDPSELVWHIENAVRGLSNLKRDYVMHSVFTQLLRFPVIERVVKGKDSRKSIISYFQSVKDGINYCKDSPDFWMHYAMARMTYEQWDMSEALFKHSRKLAEEDNNEKAKRDIENHYSKFLILSRTKSEKYKDYYGAFKQAHDVLVKQMNKDTNKYFPYRQASQYVEFISARKKFLNESDIQSFVSACKQVKSAIENVRGNLRNHKILHDCREKMDRSIEIAGLSDG